MAALAVVLVVGIAAQQKSADTAVDPVCGMTVVKANAKATFDYKGDHVLLLQHRLQGSLRQGAREVSQGPAGEDPGGRQAPAHMGQMGQMGTWARPDGCPSGPRPARCSINAMARAAR